MRVDIIVHATENLELILKSAEDLFGTKFEVEELEGHWSNPIYRLHAFVDDVLPGIYSKEGLVEGKLFPGKGVLVRP